MIRNLADGTQVKLHPETGMVLERFGRIEKTGVPAHYIKQKNESIQLVPGDPARVAVVRGIYEHHFRDGWGYVRIARDLNVRGVPSAKGRQWSLAMVRKILHNSIYTGVGLANLTTSAIYYQRGPKGPVPAGITEEDLTKAHTPIRRRPREDWFERPEPRLADYLSPALKTAAQGKQSARLEVVASQGTAPRNRDRHRDSTYILKGIMRCEQGLKMTGRLTGAKGYRVRYYMVTRAYAVPTNDSTLRRLMPAEPMEKVVLNALQEVLTDSQRVHTIIRRLARQEVKATTQSKTALAELQREIASIDQRISFVVDEVDTIGKDAARAKLQELKVRRQELEKALRSASAPRAAQIDPEAVAEAVGQRLRDFAAQLPTLPPAAVRNLLSVFVAELVVNLETRNLRVVFALPEDAHLMLDRLCLDGTSVCKLANQAHADPARVLLRVHLVWDASRRQYARRKRAA